MDILGKFSKTRFLAFRFGLGLRAFKFGLGPGLRAVKFGLRALSLGLGLGLEL